MAVTLAGIDVTGLVIEDLFDNQVDALSDTASDGSIIIYEKDRLYRDLILIGGSDWGWLSYLVMKQLLALSKAKNTTYVLNYEGVSFNVRFKSEDPPVISANQLIQRSNVADTDWYSDVVIKLMEV